MVLGEIRIRLRLSAEEGKWSAKLNGLGGDGSISVLCGPFAIELREGIQCTFGLCKIHRNY